MSDNRPADVGRPPAPRANPIVERVKAILLTPKTEWPRIEAESTTPGEIFRTYAVPLAAIGPVARLIGSVAFGYSFFGVTWRPSLGGAIGSAIVSYALSLLGVWVLALVIDALAPNFGATKNRANAFKVAAYGATAGWAAGIFGLIPSLAFLSIL
ncbi:MAG: YIP1 family protein, partial [Sphingomonadaceae bacterium]|nr:YIP1 family protein [Sphingomonadaceae bacterium]